MKFGIWLEPEMVNPLSQLYKEHPDWIYHFENRPTDTSRGQYVLNITKREEKDATLKKLTIKEYIETGKDRKDISSPEFYIFGKEVQENLIYIKIKIRDKINHKVFCVSFHFARYPISNFPYKY